MVRPVHPHHITLDDLSRCGAGHTIVSILIDVNGFWKYDNRESLLHDEEES
jgi:serine/threonine-protein phosphatase 2A regulatory subunit B''